MSRAAFSKINIVAIAAMMALALCATSVAQTSTSYSPPQLIFPVDGARLDCDALRTIMFRWTPVTPILQNFDGEYLLSVVEVLPGQSTTQALLANQPLLDQTLSGSTYFDWPATIPPPEPGKNYAWTVQAVSYFGPIGTSNGYAEPHTFSCMASTYCPCVPCDLVITSACNSAPGKQGMIGDAVSFSVSTVSHCPDNCTPKVITGDWTITFTPQGGGSPTVVKGKGTGSNFTAPSGGTVHADFTGWETYCGASDVCDCNTASADVTIYAGTTDGGTTSTASNPPPVVDTPKVNVASHHYVTTSCGCDCGGSAITVQENNYAVGKPQTGAHNMPYISGTTYTFTLATAGTCTDNCAPQITANWSLDFVDFKGGTLHNEGTGMSYVFIAPSPGTVSMQFTQVQLSCGGAVCPCEDAEVILYLIAPTTPPNDSNKVCTLQPPSTDKGEAIQLGARLDEPELFQYPRAVPIRAYGVDWDNLIYTCGECDVPGASTLKWPVPDRVDNFVWKLDGPGSLNTAIDANAAASAQAQIDQLLALIASLQAQRAQLAASRADIPAKLKAEQDAAQLKLDKVNQQLKTENSILDSLNGAVRTLTSIREAINKDAANDSMAIVGLQQEIQTDSSLREDVIARLQGKPDKGELEALANANNEHNDVVNSQSDVATKEQAVQDGAAQLDGNLKSAEQAEADADSAYLVQKKSFDAKAAAVYGLLGALRSDTLYAAFSDRAKDWNDKFSAWLALLPANAASVNNDRNQVNASADSTITAGAATRAQLLAAMTTQINALDASLASQCTSAPCNDAAATVRDAADAYILAAANIVRRGKPVDKHGVSQLRTARAALDASQTMLVGVMGISQTASQAYQGALQNYESQISALNKNVDDAQNALDAKNDLFAASSEAFDSLQNVRIDNDQSTHDIRDDSVRWLNDSMLSKRAQIEQRMIPFADHVNARDTNDAAQGAVQFEITSTQKIIDGLNDLIQKLNAVLAKTDNDELAKLDAQIQQVNQQIDQALNDLNAAQAKAAQASKGTKEATGPVVYYIPPPLEEIMKDKAKFQALKDSVANSQNDYTLAVAAKAQVQGQMVTLLEKISSNLSTLKIAMEDNKSWSDSVDAIQKELGSAKPGNTQKNLDEQKKAQDEKKEADEKAKELNDKLDATNKALQEQRAKYSKALDVKNVVNQNVVGNLDQLYKAEVARKQSGLAYRDAGEKWYDAATGRAILRDQLRAANQDYVRVYQQLERAQLANHPDEVQQLQGVLDAKKNDIKKLNDALATMNATEATLDANAQAIGVTRDKALTDVKSADATLKNNLIGRNVAKKKLRTITDAIDSSVANARAQQEQRDEQKRIADEAQAKLDKINKEISEGDDIKEIQDRLDDAKKKKDATDAKMTMSKKAIGDAQSQRQKLVDSAAKKVKDAKDRVTANKKALRDFLLDEFYHVNLVATITIVGDDAVIDGYRSDDPATKIQQNISYAGSRTPVFPEIPIVDKHSAVASVQECVPSNTFSKGGDVTGVAPSVEMNEPRTVALLYHNGEPLWPEWPVISDTAKKPLAKETPLFLTDGTDEDQMVYLCAAAGDCLPTDSVTAPIADLVSFSWNGAHIINGNVFPIAIAEYQDVDPGKCDAPEKFGVSVEGNVLAGDKPYPEGMQPDVNAGVMIEIPDSLIGSPNELQPLSPRVVKGNHKGLAGESITLTAKLTKGNSKNYGFIDGNHTQDKNEKISGQPKFTKQTNSNGNADVQFYFGDGVGEFDIDVEWKRSGVCAKKTLHAKTPIQLSFLRLASAAPTPCWDAATKVWNGADPEATAKAMPAAHDDNGELTDAYKNVVDAVGGLLDHNSDSLNGIDVTFEVETPDSSDVNPDHAKTSLYGIARVEVTNPPDDGELTLDDWCTDENVAALCTPDIAEKTRTAAGVNQFTFGAHNPFVVKLDNNISCGEPQSGNGKLTVSGTVGDLLSQLGVTDGLDVSFDGIVVECDGSGSGDAATATDGTVEWSEGKTFSIRSFEVTVASISLSAGMQAIIKGSVKKDSVIKDAIGFSGAVDEDGNVIAGLDNLPEFSIAGYTLKQGAQVMIDFGADPALLNAPMDADHFDRYGLIIPVATLQLPAPFTRGADTATLSVKDFSIDKQGVSGSVTMKGGLEFGFAGFGCKVKEGGLTLVHSRLDNSAYIKATITLPKPVDGKVDATISYVGANSASTWLCKFTSKDPINFPSVGVVATLESGTIQRKSDGTSALWDAHLTGSISSNGKFGKISIKDLAISSDGSISVKNISIDTNINVGTGFSFTVKTLSFTFAPPQDKYELSLVGEFALPAIGIENAAGHVSIKTGGVIDMGLDALTINIEKNPFTLKGNLSFAADVWEGDFDVSLAGLSEGGGSSGLKGMVVYGTQKVSEDHSYTYWYGELSLTIAGGVPLGQSGVSLTEIGGGVGMNYNPPIGSNKGSPADLGDGLAFKALVGLADASGNLVAGRLTMVLILARQQFSLNGKVWLFNREESMFGEGQLNLQWGTVVGVDGNVRMFVGVPDAKGNIARFNGDIGFTFHSGEPAKVESNDISASVIDAIRFKGNLIFTSDHAHLDGTLRYDLGESSDAGGNGSKPKTIGPLIIEAHLLAKATADYNNPFSASAATPTFALTGQFTGQWNVAIKNPFGDPVNLLNGDIALAANATATVIGANGTVTSLTATFEAHAQIHASVDIGITTLTYDSNDVDLGYTFQLP